MATTVVVVSDTHVNSKFGLCPAGPIPLRDGGGKYLPAPDQEQLWEWWQDFGDGIPRGRPWWLVVNGDMVQGVHKHTELVIRRSLKFQTDLAVQCYEELIGRGPGSPERIYFLRGTKWHVGKEADHEALVAEELGGELDINDAPIFWHLEVELHGHLLDFRHHPRTKGTMPHTRLSGAGRLAELIWNARAKAGRRVPDLAVRSHLHHYADSGYNPPLPRTVQTPCWQIGYDDYLNKLGVEELASIGGLYLTVEEGKPIQMEPRIYRFPRR